MERIIENLSEMKPEDLVSLITSNPQMLSDMKQEELCEISGKINPFSKNVAGEDKYVAFSFVNTRLEYLKTLQTISVSKFLKKLCEPEEIEEWGALYSEEERQIMQKALPLFVNHFLTYNPSIHCKSLSQKDSVESNVPYDFIARWERFEELNNNEITKEMRECSYYNPVHQATIQVYDTYQTEAEANKFAENNSQSIGLDIMVAKTNSWIVLKDTDETLELTKYPGDENRIIEGILHNMKEEQKIGEEMLKKRINLKKDEHPENFANIDPDAGKVLAPIQPHLNRKSEQELLEYNKKRDNRLALLEESESIQMLVNEKGANFFKTNLTQE